MKFLTDVLAPLIFGLSVCHLADASDSPKKQAERPSATAAVRVWQGTLTLPTYEEDAPDTNPPFDQYANSRFNYPYTLRNNVSDRRKDHAWRAVFLENEYLKCSVLPDLGGHVYTCTDKISGQPMFYANPSIKKANISYRGAWAAFGIEFNFPVSHNWVSLSPVDFTFRSHADGSASVLVGNIDRVYGMQWSVEIVLRPGSTVLEEKVTLYNRSDVRHRFYWWNNAGVEAWDDSRVEYPMRFAASHGFRDVQPWPVDSDGTDLSVIKNQTKGPVSLFVHGSREPFMGVWHPHTNTGVVHFAEYAQLPAKKIWSWGTDPDGLDWRKTLSDNNSAYVEVQAGLFRNQETYAFLEPRRSIRFSEFWMPVRETGGISRANLAGVIHLRREGSRLLAVLNANQKIPSAKLLILSGDHQVFAQQSDLAPEHLWSHELQNADPEQKYTFELRDANGNVLLHHTEGQYDWTPIDEIRVGPQPSYHIPEAEQRTEDDWLQLGKEQELDGNGLAALQTYKDGLAQYPQSFELQKSAGRLCVGLLQFQSAKEYLQRVRARNTSDTEVAYYLGMAYDGLGQSREAREAYEAAALLPAFRSAAQMRLAELSARQRSLHEAENYLRLAIQAEPDDVRALEELATTLRAAGRQAESAKVAKEALARFPQSYFLLEQAGHPDLQHLGDDAQRVLNIAAQYMRLGLYKDAIEVLSRKYPPSVADQSEPGQLPPSQHPMVAYYRAFCAQKLGQPSSAYFSAAARLRTEYVFPSRAEDLEVLTAALKANPQDANAQYLIGTLYFSKGLSDLALEHWEKARQHNTKLPVLHASLGRALLHIKDEPQEAVAVFQEGLRYDPQNLELYRGMDQSLSLLQRPAQERVAALQKYPDLDHMPTPLVYELILNLTEAGEFDKAEALFHNRFFQREEGGTNVRQVWLEVQIQKSLSLAGRANCREALTTADRIAQPVPGLDFTRDGLEPYLASARFNYLLGKIYKACAVPQKAQTHFAIASQRWNVEDAFWSWKASQELGNAGTDAGKQKLEALLSQMRKNADSSPSAWWLYHAALIDGALGNKQQAHAELRVALLEQDQLMSYHLSRLAMAETNQ